MRFSDLVGNSFVMAILASSVVIPFSVALYKLVHGVFEYFRHQKKVKTASKTAVAARSSEKPQATFVRHDDVVQLNDVQSRQKEHALGLVKQGKPREAAAIFRALTLDRLAIQTLEDAGLYKDACAILFDKKLPNRAGILYLRHNLYIEAAECFLLAKLYFDAGESFQKGAVKDYRYLAKAAEAFEAGQRFAEAITCHEGILNFERATDLCLKIGDFNRAVGLVLNPHFSMKMFEKFDSEILSRIISEVAVNPKTAQDMGVMLAKCGSRVDFRSIASRFGGDKSLYVSFLVGSGVVVASAWVEDMNLNKDNAETSAYQAFADALRELKFYDKAALVYEKIGRKSEAVCCFLLSGELAGIHRVFGENRKNEAQEILKSLERYGEAAKGPESQQAGANFWNEVNEVLARSGLRS